MKKIYQCNSKKSAIMLLLFVVLGFFSLSKQSYALATESFSGTELDLTKPLTIAVNRTSAPYHYVNSEGEVAGIMPDLWRLWAKKQQVEIEFVVMPWSDTLTSVGESKVDIHAGLSIVDSRKQYLRFSTPHFPIYMYFYVNKKLHEVNKINDLAPYTVGVVKNSAQPEMLAKSYPWLPLRPYINRYAVYQAALQGEIFVFTGMEKLSDAYPEHDRLTGMFPAYKTIRYQQGDYAVAVAKDNKVLMSFIEEGFAKIDPEEKATIERKWLGIEKKKNSLLVAFDPNYAPYMALSPLGKPQGLLIDIWRLWSKNTGIAVEFVAREITNDVNLVQQNKVDVLLAYPEVATPPSNTLFTQPIYQGKMKTYIAKTFLDTTTDNSVEVSSLEELSQRYPNKVIGVWQQSSFKDKLNELYPALNIRYFNTVPEILKAIEDNEISAMIGLEDILSTRLIQNNLQAQFYHIEQPDFMLDLSPLIHVNNAKLARIINDGFKGLDIKNLVALEKRWLNGGEHYYQRQAKKVTLSAQEQEFLANYKTVNFGLIKDLSPVESINERGDFVGINRDIINLISQRTDIKFNYVAYDSWQQLYQALLDNKVDMLASITPTEQREKEILFSESYWKMPWVILHQQKTGKQLSLKDFYGKSLAIVKGYYLIGMLREQYPLINFKLVDNREQAVVAMQQDIVAGFVTTMASATQLLKKDHLVPLMISVVEEVNLDISHFGINNQLPLLQSIINKGLLSISERETQAIYDAWFSVSINTGLNKKMVMQVAAQVGVIILFVLVVIVMWNRRLQVEIKRREQLEKIMKHMATHDELTGLANRVLLKDRLNSAIAFHQRQQLKIAVLFIDLDGFKSINDNYGHDVGDELLQEVASRLKGCVRESDTIVRFGGDEFVLLLTGLHSNNEAAYVAEKVLRLMQAEFTLSTDSAYIGCSIGIAVYPEDGVDDNELLKVADTLMYKVKAAGKNHYMFN
ncbi:transporter substrate-binding domain-containing protein [Colwellia sp. D2M02]|uniref:transporter substrate-binding domain-containing protein n=1 Tax=Colwellia sp. D2M02 TaxID=2841562 RepID=UPI002091605D|nr:transporter substrate-binding domain-containing protein [Colwellia sp. D2M02]